MMKKFLKFATMASVAALVFMVNMSSQSSRPQLGFQLITDAHAVLGTRRRTRRRSLAIGYEAGAHAASSQSATSSQSTSSGAQQQSATSAAQQPTAPTQPPQPAASGKPLPLGTVVSALPAGCTPTSAAGVEYYHCGSDYYRAVFQGNTLVYVTASP